MKRNIKIYISIIILSVCVVSGFYVWQKNIYVDEYKPVYKPEDGCKWIKQSFSINKIYFYQYICDFYENSTVNTYYEKEKGKIMSLANYSNNKPWVAIEIFEKDIEDDPLTVIERDWFSKLTDEQKNNCEIKKENREIDNPSTEIPEVIDKTKVRFFIQLKKDIFSEVLRIIGTPLMEIEKYDEKYDYMCGKETSSILGTSSPYFEFNLNNKGKYFKFNDYYDAGDPDIDLNSIKFE